MGNSAESLYEVPTSRKEAEAIQKELQKKVILQNGFEKLETVAGVDLAIISAEKMLVCGIIVFSYPDLREIERVSTRVQEQFDYIPGLLAFRESPAIFKAFEKLKKRPDLLMIDGHGIAHQRGLGIASHVGVILDIPTIGVAKKRLFGRHNEPPDSEGGWTPLIHPRNGKTIGAVLRTKRGTKPVFVSSGHKIDLITAINITRKCAKGYRIPEPTRQADIFVAQLKTVSGL
ncbi:MAG TPA: deoxyribonuclease V [Thermodesulfobacteriota bacterium]|nr:deoxyribonuclease V [Thermodesulfobacteriota bacterium]